MIARKTKRMIYNLVTIALLVAGMTYVCSRFVHLGHVVYTDNAQVRQHITPVNTRVQGFIKKVYFEEYQPVRRGDTLLVIEDTESRLGLAQAEADLANAQAGQQVTNAGIATTQSNLDVGEAAIEEMRVRMVNADREWHRYESLLEQEAVTRQLREGGAARAGAHPLGRQRGRRPGAAQGGLQCGMQSEILK